MNAKAILSSKGQVVIPKLLRNKLGITPGSELIIELKEDKNLLIQPVKKNIDKFFNLNKKDFKEKTDIDQTIKQAVLSNDRS